MITGIKTNEVEDQSILVGLSGEFDLDDLESLRTVLDGALSSGLPLWVDLSRVTFLDMRVAQELAVQSQLHGDRLKLRNSSWQVEVSSGACGFGGPDPLLPQSEESLSRESSRPILERVPQ